MAQSVHHLPVQAQTKLGKIEGNYDVITKLQMYFGVPFAKPPVGELRWKAPQPMDAWEGVMETKAFGPRAVQPYIWDDMLFRSDGLSEDCLYLNIWTPARHDTKDLPVLFYVYGGGYVAGDGSEKRYDGASMAQKGMVVVTCNYRLNIFGFFAHPELSTEAPYKASGNYGLLDQQAALQWVYENIEAFGGDPKRITIAGESAGSVSACAHTVSPLSRHMLAGAIGESGAGIPPTLAPIPLAEAEQQGLGFAQDFGFESIAELRALSAKDLLELYLDSRRFGFPTVIDGYFYPKSVADIYAENKAAQVPLLLGWTSAEIPGYALTQGPYTEEAYVQKVTEAYPDHADEILKHYPYDSPEILEQSATDLASDRFIAYSTWKWFDLHRQYTDQPVYRYLYAKLRPPSTKADGNQGPPPIGAPHASEIEYCLGNLPLVNIWDWTEEDYQVSQTMQDYFANFIIHGNPNTEGLPEWPAIKKGEANPSIMVLDVVSKAQESQVEARYELLDQIYSKNK